MTVEQLQRAYTEATEAVQEQKQLVREAESHLIYLEDQKRRIWVQLRDAERTQGAVHTEPTIPKSFIKEVEKEARRAGRKN